DDRGDDRAGIRRIQECESAPERRGPFPTGTQFRTAAALLPQWNAGPRSAISSARIATKACNMRQRLLDWFAPRFGFSKITGETDVTPRLEDHGFDVAGPAAGR